MNGGFSHPFLNFQSQEGTLQSLVKAWKVLSPLPWPRAPSLLSTPFNSRLFKNVTSRTHPCLQYTLSMYNCMVLIICILKISVCILSYPAVNSPLPTVSCDLLRSCVYASFFFITKCLTNAKLQKFLLFSKNL